MANPKLDLLQGFCSKVAESSNLYAWFSIPGGLILGKATDLQDYLKNQYGSPSKTQIDLPIRLKMPQQNRFIYLKDVTLHQGSKDTYFNVAMVDGLDISAWGFFDHSAAI